jgi:hypothetical protein
MLKDVGGQQQSIAGQQHQWGRGRSLKDHSRHVVDIDRQLLP